MKDHLTREMINELRDVATAWNGTKQLRERIAHVVHKYLNEPTSKDSLQVGAPKPAAWVCMDEDRVMSFRFDKPKDIKNWKPMYAEPPKREWVGLTDEEILDLADEHLYNGGKARDFIYHAHDIEAKLKEKNHVS